MLFDPQKFIDYPFWSKTIVAIWLLLTVAVFLIALFVRPSQKEALASPDKNPLKDKQQMQQQTVKQNQTHQMRQTTGIRVIGKNVIVKDNDVRGADLGYDIKGENITTEGNKYTPPKR